MLRRIQDGVKNMIVANIRKNVTTTVLAIGQKSVQSEKQLVQTVAIEKRKESILTGYGATSAMAPTIMPATVQIVNRTTGTKIVAGRVDLRDQKTASPSRNYCVPASDLDQKQTYINIRPATPTGLILQRVARNLLCLSC
jgi:hypothetical protein